MLSTLEGGETPKLRQANRQIIFNHGRQLIEQTSLDLYNSTRLPRLTYKSGSYLDYAMLKLQLTLANPLLFIDQSDVKIAELSFFGPAEIDDFAIFKASISTFHGEGSGFGSTLAELGDLMIQDYIRKSALKLSYPRVFVVGDVLSYSREAAATNSWATQVMQDLGFTADNQIIQPIVDRLQYNGKILVKEY